MLGRISTSSHDHREPRYACNTACTSACTLSSFQGSPPDFRLQLSSTDYGNFLANEPLPLSTATIADKATEKLVAEFYYIRTNAVEPLATFMDYITYAYMIDNVILLTLGTLHERDTHELLERCHPLGVFDTMPALCVATNVEELYHSVLVETPLGES